VTDHIEEFTRTGLRLRSGKHLDADVVVTATGLNLLPLGGIDMTVDGEPVIVGERVAYKGMMLDAVPNMAFAIGYTNASWTLKVDLARYVCRLLVYMRRNGYAVVTPRLPSESMTISPFIDMTSGYFERSRSALPGRVTGRPGSSVSTTSRTRPCSAGPSTRTRWSSGQPRRSCHRRAERHTPCRT
jgi:monooxygenase